ncbi:DUF2914 domain-containing protein [Ketobacter sp.]|uniref:DUF2914 domain-containing protein n=1 Tax=Ketobacter sp. TaxID=2083498 RepID=UPI0025BCD904|nr:DUF2914 domain-containing protein [Ketobacter sp.]
MRKQDTPDFNHYQHNAPEFTEEILWHRVYAAGAAALLVVALIGWGLYAALGGASEDRSEAPFNEAPFNVEALAPTAALPALTEEPEVVEPQAGVEPAAEVATPGPAEQPAPIESTSAQPVAPQSVAPQPGNNKEFAVKLSILSQDITDAALTNAMSDLEPATKLTSTEDLGNGFLKLYFYTDLQGRAGDALLYSWYRNDKRVARIRIPVGSDRWRSHASKNISANMRGDWKVVVTDRQSKTLATAEFYLK